MLTSALPIPALTAAPAQCSHMLSLPKPWLSPLTLPPPLLLLLLLSLLPMLTSALTTAAAPAHTCSHYENYGSHPLTTTTTAAASALTTTHAHHLCSPNSHQYCCCCCSLYMRCTCLLSLSMCFCFCCSHHYCPCPSLPSILLPNDQCPMSMLTSALPALITAAPAPQLSSSCSFSTAAHIQCCCCCSRPADDSAFSLARHQSRTDLLSIFFIQMRLSAG